MTTNPTPDLNARVDICRRLAELLGYKPINESRTLWTRQDANVPLYIAAENLRPRCPHRWWRPDLDHNAAFEVVAEMERRGYKVLATTVSTGWKLMMWRPGDEDEHSHTADLRISICEAALRALETESKHAC